MTFGKSNLEAGLDTFITKRTLHRKEAAFKSYDAAVRKKITPEHAIQQALVEAVKGLSDKERKLETARKAAGLTRFNLALTHAKEKVAFRKKPTDAKTKPTATVTKTETETREGRTKWETMKAIFKAINSFIQRIFKFLHGTIGIGFKSAVIAAAFTFLLDGVLSTFMGIELPTGILWVIGIIAFLLSAAIFLAIIARDANRKEEKLNPTTSHA